MYVVDVVICGSGLSQRRQVRPLPQSVPGNVAVLVVVFASGLSRRERGLSRGFLFAASLTEGKHSRIERLSLLRSHPLWSFSCVMASVRHAA